MLFILLFTVKMYLAPSALETLKPLKLLQTFIRDAVDAGLLDYIINLGKFKDVIVCVDQKGAASEQMSQQK